MDNMELRELIETKTRFEVLLNALKAAAGLDYKGEYLTFNQDIVDAVFAAVAPDEYAETLAAKRAARAVKEAAKKAGDQV